MTEDAAAAAELRAAIDLVRLDAAGARIEWLRADVLRLRVAPGQRGLVTEAVETLPRADADPDRTPFAVLRGGRVVGFGIIDRGGALARLAGIADDTARAVMLRAFYLAPEWQGRGIGRRACAAVDPLVRSVHPGADEAFVVVAESNRAAVRAYTAGGFLPTRRCLTDETASRQVVLRRAVA